MLGIIFGTICLILLVKVIVRPYRWRHHHSYGGGRRRYFLRRLFRRLNTGPGQEKVMLGEIDALRETARGLRGELKGVRANIATMMRDEAFDRSKMEALFRQQDDLLGKMRSAVSGAFEKIHGVLDTRQKSDLADIVENGFFFGRHFRHGC